MDFLDGMGVSKLSGKVFFKSELLLQVGQKKQSKVLTELNLNYNVHYDMLL